MSGFQEIFLSHVNNNGTNFGLLNLGANVVPIFLKGPLKCGITSICR